MLIKGCPGWMPLHRSPAAQEARSARPESARPSWDNQGGNGRHGYPRNSVDTQERPFLGKEWPGAGRTEPSAPSPGGPLRP